MRCSPRFLPLRLVCFFPCSNPSSRDSRASSPSPDTLHLYFHSTNLCFKSPPPSTTLPSTFLDSLSPLSSTLPSNTNITIQENPMKIHDLTLFPDEEILEEVVPCDLFICRIGSKTDGHAYLFEAISKGEVVVVADRDLDEDATLGCQAIVTVENTHSAIPILASSFYDRPTEKLSVIAVTRINGKTTTTHLIKSLYEAIGWKTGMLGTIGYYIHDNQLLEAPNKTPDSLVLQKIMAKMLDTGAKSVVMEASSHGLALGR
ncbi:hypothetical protein KSP40_PGU000214 [Platanthera guangdongensis]|uniref:Mur ligase central domain-containing protein n=1 Tax=Platanthera guangdongensis TaxID=2320717 RepID=A0ABR2LRF9_9ASPA